MSVHCYCLAAVLLPSGIVPGKTWPKTLHFQNARGFNILPHFYSVYSTSDTAGLGHLLLSIISVQMITSRSIAGKTMLWKMLQCLEAVRVEHLRLKTSKTKWHWFQGPANPNDLPSTVRD